MIKKATIITLLFILSCCGSYINGPDTRLSIIKDFKPTSSIVIIRTEYRAQLDWRTDLDNFLYIGSKDSWYKESGVRYESYVTAPGYYYLNRIWFPYPPGNIEGRAAGKSLVYGASDAQIYAKFDSDSNATLKISSKAGWNKKLNAPNFASFETNPGEIVYIGDLFFTFTKQKYWVKGKINLEVKDNYDQAVSYFRTQYPEYKDKPVIKRLAKPGVLLDNYDAGIFW